MNKAGDVGSVSGIKGENIKYGHVLLMEWCAICLMFEWRLHLHVTSGRITLFSFKSKKRNARSIVGLVQYVWEKCLAKLSVAEVGNVTLEVSKVQY